MGPGGNAPAARLRYDGPPEQVEFYTSGRASNEAAYLFQLFAREFGSNNFPDCSNMCHEPTNVGLPQSIGIGKGTVSLDDFDSAELVISIGHNPGINHPRMMGTLHELARKRCRSSCSTAARAGARAFHRSAKRHRNGDLQFDPYRLHLLSGQSRRRRRALKGIAKALLQLDDEHGNALDHAFIAEHTEGFADFAADLKTTGWDAIEAESGLARRDLEQVAAAYAKSNATIVTYGMGITQHNKGTANVRLIADLLLLRGNIGKPGAGICPLRAIPTCRATAPSASPKTLGRFLAKLETVFGFTRPKPTGMMP